MDCFPENGRHEHQAACRHRYRRPPTPVLGGLVLELMTAGKVGDNMGAAALPGSLPKAEWRLADRDHHADWFGEALKDKGIEP